MYCPCLDVTFPDQNLETTRRMHQQGLFSLLQCFNYVSYIRIRCYKIQYGLVAVSMPSYFERPTRISRHMHSLSFRQVHVSADYYRYSFFPMTFVWWNRIPADLQDFWNGGSDLLRGFDLINLPKFPPKSP